jgi:Ca2+-binding EF-hand superfamily protein
VNLALVSIVLSLSMSSPSPRYSYAANPVGQATLVASPGQAMRAKVWTAKTRHDAAILGFVTHKPGVKKPRYKYVPEAFEQPPVTAIFFGEERVLRVKIITQHDGKSLAESWAAIGRKLFTGFDRDGDGYLNAWELEHIFAVPGLKDVFNGNYYTHANGSPPSLEELDLDGDGKIHVDELLKYYEGALAHILSVRSTTLGETENDSITEAVIDLLDTNRDGKLSEAELRKAEKLLATLDSNEDECLAFGEMTDRPKKNAGMMAMTAMSGMMSKPKEAEKPKPTGDCIAALDELPSTAYQALLKHYDINKDGVLSGAEIPFDAAITKRLDTNNDGKLTQLELYQLNKLPPDIVVTMNHAKSVENSTIHITGASGTVLPQGIDVRSNQSNRAIVRIGRQTLDFTCAPPQMDATEDRFDAILNSVFSGEKVEIRESDLSGVSNQFLLVVFDAADRNDDGVLTRPELKHFLDLQKLIVGQSQQVSTSVSKPNLFQMLDDNQDGKLGVRELRTAWERLIVLEPEGAKFVTRGILRPMASFRLSTAETTFFNDSGDGQSSNRRFPKKPVGPRWFQFMDRNGDGDVSRNEFLGDEADFRKLDTNNDGLISWQEAEAFGKTTK